MIKQINILYIFFQGLKCNCWWFQLLNRMNKSVEILFGEVNIDETNNYFTYTCVSEAL